MRWFEWANFGTFTAIGLAAIGTGLSRQLLGFHGTPYWFLGFHHSPETYEIAGLGLVALIYRWKLLGFPAFVIVTQLVDMPWAWYNPPFNAIQLILLIGGYAICRPSFKNWVWLLVVVAINQPGSFQSLSPLLSRFDILNYHHIAEISTFLLFLFNIKSFDSPIKAKDDNVIVRLA